MPGLPEAYYAKVNDRDGSVVYTYRLDNPDYRDGISTSIKYANGKVHVAFYEAQCTGCSDREIYYRQYDATTGQVTVPRQQVSQIIGDNYYGRLAVSKDGTRVNIVWECQHCPGGGPYYDIRFSQISATDGHTIVPERSILDPPGIFSCRVNAQAAIGPGDQLFTIWRQYTHYLSCPEGDPFNAIYLKKDQPEIVDLNTFSNSMHRLHAPLNVGDRYFAAASFGISPGIPLPPPDTRIFQLNPDVLFFLSDMFLENRIGTINRNGEGTMWLNIPAGAPVGTVFYLAFITTDNQGRFHAVASPKRYTVQP